MQGDDPPFGATAHGARKMEGRGGVRTPRQDESAQRCELRLEGIDACFEESHVGIRGLGDTTRLAPRRIGRCEIGAELKQGRLDGPGEGLDVRLLRRCRARAEHGVELVHRTVGVHANVILCNTRSAEEICLAEIAAFGVDRHAGEYNGRTMQGVSLVRTGSAAPRAAQIEAGRLRLCLDPVELSLDLRDAQSSIALRGIVPRIEALAPDGGALPIGPRRTLSVGELKGRGGPALRLEVQAVGRGFLGVRWTLEVAGAGESLSCTLAVENRTNERLLLRTLVPLALGTRASGDLPFAASATPLLPVHVLRSGEGAFLALGFTTELRHRVSLRLARDPSLEPAFSLENTPAARTLEPGEGVESERAWLALGAEEASLLVEWARLAGLEMEARAPGRAVFLTEAERHALPALAQELRHLGDLVVVEPRVDIASGKSDTRALHAFASEAHAMGAMPGATLGGGPGTPRAELAAQCAVLRSLGIEHVAGRAEETTLGSVGLIDTLRLPTLPGPEGVRRALDLAFSGQRLWRLDPGPALGPAVGPPSEEERTRFCVFALLGAALRVAGDPRPLDAVRAHWLRLATPGLARPAVAVPIPGGRALVVSLVGGRRAVLLVNESGATSALGIPFRSLGVTGPHHVFEFWQEEALGLAQEAVAPVPVPAGGSRLLALTPVAPRAQVIGTALHLGMGSLEASGLRAREDGPLELTLRLPGQRSGAVWIAFPGEAAARRIEVSFEDVLTLSLPLAQSPS
jgi:hypothetical protein